MQPPLWCCWDASGLVLDLCHTPDLAGCPMSLVTSSAQHLCCCFFPSSWLPAATWVSTGPPSVPIVTVTSTAQEVWHLWLSHVWVWKVFNFGWKLSLSQSCDVAKRDRCARGKIQNSAPVWSLPARVEHWTLLEPLLCCLSIHLSCHRFQLSGLLRVVRQKVLRNEHMRSHPWGKSWAFQYSKGTRFTRSHPFF